MKSAQLENIIGSMTVDVKHQGRQESWRPSESERTDDEATDKVKSFFGSIFFFKLTPKSELTYNGIMSFIWHGMWCHCIRH